MPDDRFKEFNIKNSRGTVDREAVTLVVRSPFNDLDLPHNHKAHPAVIHLVGGETVELRHPYEEIVAWFRDDD